ncbi:hypothetical protein [Lewinella sp. JB7]|uniref:hypothetical protein n=1 Tax=Lewinella sp. JB7 TaxID=2962887 RepID=UPI0020CA11FE|nr:hypothetical protein [Lewinella sp. JB7]MCP9235947.1 hypothetical protein [Lewinella sp. JB7]
MISIELWLITLATSWFLCGLIWVVQLVHYPAFRFVADFPAFHRHHTASIGVVVGPLMIVELLAASLVVYRSGLAWTWLIPWLAVVAIWGQTFLVAVPLHRSLSGGRDEEAIDKLILANWPRTVLWTFKALWVSGLFVLRPY